MFALDFEKQNLKMTVGSREDLFAQAKYIDDTERLIGRVLAGKWEGTTNNIYVLFYKELLPIICIYVYISLYAFLI